MSSQRGAIYNRIVLVRVMHNVEMCNRQIKRTRNVCGITQITDSAASMDLATYTKMDFAFREEVAMCSILYLLSHHSSFDAYSGPDEVVSRAPDTGEVIFRNVS